MSNGFKVPSTAASETNAAADDQCSIDDQLDEFERLIRAAHNADLRPATSMPAPDRWH
ncbi:hypothetical protein GGR39_003458 [Novosphingobium fluoreni]|uniref:Uncharacterized protein n=2 Tax=Novosphingobium fluoreni TaxID=1391222 RepID=A0A7W6G057_9SPHN|nr:hypothetical protein [Novosphingobium fluoreni]